MYSFSHVNKSTTLLVLIYWSMMHMQTLLTKSNLRTIEKFKLLTLRYVMNIQTLCVLVLYMESLHKDKE